MNNDNELFPYQKEGAFWLSTKKLALLADEMGLGKSAQAINAADKINAFRVCTICPAIARTNWLREFEKFSKLPRNFEIVFSKSHSPRTGCSIIISYDLAVHFSPRDFGEFDLVILDEAHYLKSIKTKRSQKILGKEGWIRYAKKVWALTGTPAPNHAGELWPLLYTFGVVSESYEQFIEKYCNILNTHFGQQITGTKSTSIAELKHRLSKVMLRRLSREVLTQLPSLSFNEWSIDPIDSENHLGFDLLTDPRFQKEKEKLDLAFGKLDVNSVEALSILEGLALSVSTIRRYVGLKKMGAIADAITKELESGAYNKIVLFAVHNQVIEMLAAKLGQFNPVVITGHTPQQKRQENIDSFQNNSRVQVFIGNIQAAGTAITLTAANQCVFVEQDWVPGNNAQAAKRIHRISQTKPVFIRMASLANSFDEIVTAIVLRKTKELTQIFDDEKTIRKELQYFKNELSLSETKE